MGGETGGTRYQPCTVAPKGPPEVNGVHWARRGRPDQGRGAGPRGGQAGCDKGLSCRGHRGENEARTWEGGGPPGPWSQTNEAPMSAPMTAAANHSKCVSQDRLTLPILESPTLDLKPGVSKVPSGASRGESLFPLFQLLESALIPWLVAPSSSFKAGSAGEVFLIGHHSDSDSAPLPLSRTL